ncbi:SGNH/GDSL hydrolase family protein, partial [bacterium]|nr:SGNH/GDSL hydrolase family protein [candidate division CSSED10-310 bacterium]
EIMLTNGLTKKYFIWSMFCFAMLSVTVQPGHSSYMEFFRTAPADSPELIEPVDGARFTAGDPIVAYTFSSVTGAVGYEISFAFLPDFSDEFLIECTQSGFDLSNYISQATWDDSSFRLFWRVRAQLSATKWTDWSDGWEMSKSVSPAPRILSPGQDARFGVDDPMPVLSWTPLDTCETYGVEIGADADFMNTYGWFSIDSTRIDLNENGDPDVWNDIVGTFYWRVWGFESGDVPTPMTESYFFSKTIIDKPAPFSPENHEGFPTECLMPDLEWEPVDGAITYHVQIMYGMTPFTEGLNYISTPNCYLDFGDYGVSEDMWNAFYGQLKWRVAAVDTFSNHGSFSPSFDFLKIASYRYMAYGDSITGGYGSESFGTGFAGYPPILRTLLRSQYGNQVEVLCQQNRSWFPGGHAYTGEEKLEMAMKTHAPEYVLIMFGTVDAIDPGAPGCENFDCHVKEHVGNMVDTIRAYHAIPLITVLPPINPESDRAYVQDEVDEINDDLRELAIEKDVLMADMEEAFLEGSLELPEYYYEGDWAHFNDEGYTVMANEWFSLL